MILQSEVVIPPGNHEDRRKIGNLPTSHLRVRMESPYPQEEEIYRCARFRVEERGLLTQPDPHNQKGDCYAPEAGPLERTTHLLLSLQSLTGQHKECWWVVLLGTQPQRAMRNEIQPWFGGSPQRRGSWFAV